MNVLLVAYYFPPDNNGGVQRPLAFYNMLKEEGIAVDVITHGTKTEKQGDIHRVFDIHKGSLLNKSLYLTLRLYSKLCSYLGIYISYYFVWELFALKYIKKLLKDNQFDIILLTYPPVECLKLAEYLVNNTTIPVVIDYRDPLIFESAEQSVFDKFPHIQKKYNNLETILANKSKLALHVSPAMKEYFEITYPSSKNMLLPNGFNPSDFEKLHKIPNERFKGVFNKDKLSLLYTGTLSYYDKDRNLNLLFDAIRLLKDKHLLEVIVVGDFKNADFDAYKDLIDDHIIKTLPKVSRDEALFLQKKADILLLVTGSKRKSVATGKLFEYLFSSKPILAFAKNSYAEQIVQETKTGRCFSNEDLNPLIDYLNEALLSFQLGKNNYLANMQAIHKYNRKEQVRLLASKLKEVQQNENN